MGVVTGPGVDRRPVLMLVHSYYDEDPRVRREAEALVASGRPVTVVALRRDEDHTAGIVEGVRVVRLDVQRHQGAGLGTYLSEYCSFLLRAGWRAWRLHRIDPVALVQVHSLPDFLVFAALPLRLAGVPVVLDLHEAMPELFRSRFPRAASRTIQWLLRFQERASIAASTATITTTTPMRERLVRLGVRPSKVSVVRNVPSLARFDPRQHPGRGFAEDGFVRLVYAGALTPIYEVDVALRALALLVSRRPGLRITLDVYGRGDTAAALETLARDLGVDDIVHFHGRIAIESMPAAIARMDIGIGPTTLDSFTALTLSTKVSEYAVMDKPVVASRLPLVEESFPAGSIATYEPGDPSSMAAAIERLLDDPADREARVRAAGAAVRASGWEIEGAAYVGLVTRLATDAPRPGPAVVQATPSSR